MFKTENHDKLNVIYLESSNPERLLIYKTGLTVTIRFKTEGRKYLFNDALNTLYLRLYGVRHNMVKDHSDNE